MKNLKTIVSVFAGNTILAFGIGAFLMKAQLMMGGGTGIALAFNHYLKLPVSSIVGVLNIVMFVVGALVLGRKFALTTIISTFYFPVILAYVEKTITAPLTEDLMLATLISGLVIGLGIGIVLRAGASTGGMDIPPLILNKKLGIPVSASIYVADVTILLLQMTFSSLEKALYSLILILVYTTVIDKIMTIGTQQMQAKIISTHYEEINQAIQTRLDRGTTLLAMKGGYLKQNSYEVMVVLSNRELVKLNQLVMEFDPKAFMIINKVNEVRGRGFTLRKKD